jgi:DNA invertase Pin-like site-specific DNA recombinase
VKAALYARVSTRKKAEGREDREPAWKQDPEVQLAPLRELARGRGWEVTVYQDRESGAKANRAELTRLMADARRGAFKVVLVWRFDRFARTVRQLVAALEEFQARGIDFISRQEAIDTTTPAGKLMFHMVAAFAEFERDVIRERILAGMAHAREVGTKSGKPIGRERRVFDRDSVWELRRRGWGWLRISKKVGIPVRTLRRAASGMAQTP